MKDHRIDDSSCGNTRSHRAAVSRREMLALMGAGCAGLLTASALAGMPDYRRKPGPAVSQGQIL